jgi:hypothetical protein
MEGCCEGDNELSVSMCWEIDEWLRNWRLLDQDSAPSRLLVMAPEAKWAANGLNNHDPCNICRASWLLLSAAPKADSSCQLCALPSSTRIQAANI